ncbi:GIY-YIG nuclease family protein [Bradyrhizobium sp. STM 3557]|uniref:GIY-YIG nuclease family protein n=1 Tax=Bradyrhizobium sp. STM 3557 TaxID=578920 RepID=UPI00389041CC
MTPNQRKAAITAYKERKTAGGIYAVLCRPLNRRWIGRTADLDKIQNRLWFTLRQGTSPHASLQAAWNMHGPGAFALEVVEKIDDEALDFVRERMFAERLVHWCEVHGADAI